MFNITLFIITFRARETLFLIRMYDFFALTFSFE